MKSGLKIERKNSNSYETRMALSSVPPPRLNTPLLYSVRQIPATNISLIFLGKIHALFPKNVLPCNVKEKVGNITTNQQSDMGENRTSLVNVIK